MPVPLGLKYLLIRFIFIRPNKKISVFRVMGLKILGRVGTHIFFKFFFFSEKIFGFLQVHSQPHYLGLCCPVVMSGIFLGD